MNKKLENLKTLIMEEKRKMLIKQETIQEKLKSLYLQRSNNIDDFFYKVEDDNRVKIKELKPHQKLYGVLNMFCDATNQCASIDEIRESANPQPGEKTIREKKQYVSKLISRLNNNLFMYFGIKSCIEQFNNGYRLLLSIRTNEYKKNPPTL